MTLRIQKSVERELILFRLIGRIQGDQLPALRALLKADGGDQLVLDLKDVKLVDREVVRFLEQCEAEGAQLTNCSAFIREWILQERNAIRKHRIRIQQD